MAENVAKLTAKDVLGLIQEDWVWDILVTTMDGNWDKNTIKREDIKKVDDDIYIRHGTKMYAILSQPQPNNKMKTCFETLGYINGLNNNPQHVLNGTHPAYLVASAHSVLRATIREKFLVKQYRQLEASLAATEKKVGETTSKPVPKTEIELLTMCIENTSDPSTIIYLYDKKAGVWYQVYNKIITVCQVLGAIIKTLPKLYDGDTFLIYILGATDSRIDEIKKNMVLFKEKN